MVPLAVVLKRMCMPYVRASNFQSIGVGDVSSKAVVRAMDR